MKFFRKNWPIYLAVIAGFTGLSLLGSRAFGAVRVYRDALAMPQTTVVLDAGHGGSDGGAVSCTGARECEINLAITQRLDDLAPAGLPDAAAAPGGYGPRQRRRGQHQ